MLERRGQVRGVLGVEGATVTRSTRARGGRVGAEAPGEGVEGGRGPGGLDLDPAGGVADAAGEPELRGEAPHERPEADALDDALDEDACGRRRRSWRPGRGRPGGRVQPW